MTQAIVIKLEDLVPTYTRDSNPNKMSDHDFTALVALIKEEGFLQTITVTPVKGKKAKYQIIDGHHRYWASQQAGLPTVHAIVKEGASMQKQALLGLGLNRIRGELDLSMSGTLMSEVMDKTQWTLDQVSLLTGFDQSEIDALTQRSVEDSEDLLEEVAAAAPEEEEELEGAEKPYVLEIAFKDRESYQLARKKLRKAAGKSKDLGVGLLAVLGEDVGDGSA